MILTVAAVALAAYAAEPNDITKTVANPAVPEQLSTSDLRYHTLVFYGMNHALTNNTGTVWLQRRATWPAPGIQLLSGQEKSITSTVGMSPSEWFIRVTTTNDGVVVVLLP